MSESITFDTHRYVKRLTEAGMTPRLAETLADEQKQLVDSKLAAKEDIRRLELTIAETKADLIKWLVGSLLGFSTIIVAAVLGGIQLLL